MNATASRVLTQFENWKQWIDETAILDVDRRTMLYNNVAFALAEAGRLDEAEKYLGADRVPTPQGSLPDGDARTGVVSTWARRAGRASLPRGHRPGEVSTRQDAYQTETEPGARSSLFGEQSDKGETSLASIIATGAGEPALIEQARSQLALLPR